MKLFSSESLGVIVIIFAVGYIKRNYQEGKPRPNLPAYQQVQAKQESRPKPKTHPQPSETSLYDRLWEQAPQPKKASTPSKPLFTEEQKQMGLMLLQAIVASSMQNQQRSSSQDYSEFHGYQPGRKQSQFPALRGESTPQASRQQQQSQYQNYQQPPSYQLSTSMPGGSTEAQTFVNEYNRINSGAAPGDALNLYEAIKKIR